MSSMTRFLIFFPFLIFSPLNFVLFVGREGYKEEAGAGGGGGMQREGEMYGIQINDVKDRIKNKK